MRPRPLAVLRRSPNLPSSALSNTPPSFCLTRDFVGRILSGVNRKIRMNGGSVGVSVGGSGFMFEESDLGLALPRLGKAIAPWSPPTNRVAVCAPTARGPVSTWPPRANSRSQITFPGKRRNASLLPSQKPLNVNPAIPRLNTSDSDERSPSNTFCCVRNIVLRGSAP